MILTRHVSHSQKGFTLIEVTLVIAVLIGLISVTFVGVLAYKQGSNRAMCIQNVSSVQKAMRSYCNFNELNPGDSVSDLHGKLITQGKFFSHEPACPSGGTYTFIEGSVPAVGSLYITCSILDHVPASTGGW
jgi:prepilin-type N-terminal cleavage/methylation domain-containing protein